MSFEERLHLLLFKWRPPLSNETIEEIAKAVAKLHAEIIVEIQAEKAK